MNVTSISAFNYTRPTSFKAQKRPKENEYLSPKQLLHTGDYRLAADTPRPEKDVSNVFKLFDYVYHPYEIAKTYYEKGNKFLSRNRDLYNYYKQRNFEVPQDDSVRFYSVDRKRNACIMDEYDTTFDPPMRRITRIDNGKVAHAVVKNTVTNLCDVYDYDPETGELMAALGQCYIGHDGNMHAGRYYRFDGTHLAYILYDVIYNNDGENGLEDKPTRARVLTSFDFCKNYLNDKRSGFIPKTEHNFVGQTIEMYGEPRVIFASCPSPHEDYHGKYC